VVTFAESILGRLTMKKLALVAAAALVAALFGAGSLLAAEKEKGKDDGKEVTIFRSVDLINKYVRNDKMEPLGYLEDFVIDMKDGHIVYAAVAYGETLGFGGKLFAVPPKALHVSEDGKYFVLNVTKDDFDKTAGFDANKWPAMADTKWGGANKDEKGAKEDRPKDEKKDARDEKKEDVHLRRLTSLTGTAIKDKDGNQLGTASGFGIDLTNPKVAYVALGYGGVAGVGTKYFAIPWEALEMKSFDLKSTAKSFVLTATKNDFENSPGFDWKMWPNKADNRFGKDRKKD